MSDTLLEVNNLKKYFNVSKGKYLKAVDDVSFKIERGKTLGLVGESGCGKTTVGRTIIRLYEADDGEIIFDGRKIQSLNKKEYQSFTKQIQMIFQDPYSSLNPRKTVSAIVGEGLDIHKLYKTQSQRDERIKELLEMVGLNSEQANRFPHEFSGGQRQRVGIARALSVNPEFIVCDEAISALDVSIQAQIINLLMELQEKLNLTYLFIAHDLSMVRYISDDVAVMYLGKIVEKAPSDELFSMPLHPYTQGLIDAVPVPDPEIEKNKLHTTLKGEVPSPINPPEGCRFLKRCRYKKDICSQVTPSLEDMGANHFVACHLKHNEHGRQV